METIIDGEICVDTRRLAEILEVGTTAVNKYALYYDMPHYKKGRFYLYPVNKCVEWFKKWREKNAKFLKKTVTNHKQTLCWQCQRALMGKDACSWSKEGKPVDGWIAENGVVSYCVKYCPEFIPDKPRAGADK